jgi:hypothetical protein
VEEALRLGDLVSKSVRGGTLVLPGEGGHMHTLLGGGSLGLGDLKSRSQGTVGGGDVGGLWRHTPEEGGGGERSSRRRHSQAAERKEPWEERGTTRTHRADTVAGNHTHARRMTNGGGGGGRSGGRAAGARA